MSRPAVLALLALALLQCVGIVALLAGPRPGFVVTPYYRPGPKETDWRSFDRRVRACLAQGATGDREDLRRGLDAQDRLFALRNRIHGLNVQTSRRGAEILEGLSRPELDALAKRP